MVLFSYVMGIFYLLVLSILSSYSLNSLYLTYRAWRYRKEYIHNSSFDLYPTVTVQLPIYNELYVVERLIEAVCNFEWPNKNLEIQILDDSTDETTEIIQKAIAKHRAQGLDIKYIHRCVRTGFKAGALQEGLRVAKGEFIAIFDADFVPNHDFIQKTIPFFNEPEIAFVQSKWGFLNQRYSVLTRLQFIMLNSHFCVDQYARSRAGYIFNFNGTAGVWRKTAIESAGGWQSDTLAEDLDLSYRTFLNGWKAVYLDNILTDSELPVTIEAFRQQQYRWAKGSVECALKYLPQVFQKPISTAVKIQAFFHLTGYLSQFLLLLLYLFFPITIYLAKVSPQFLSLYKVSTIFSLVPVAQIIYFVFALTKKGDKLEVEWKEVWDIPLVFLLWAGMMVNSMIPIVQAVSRLKSNFERTPKYGIEKKEDTWMGKNYNPGFSKLIKYEAAMAILNLWNAWFAYQNSHWATFAFAFAFSAGFQLIVGLSIYQKYSDVSSTNK
jgi:cellulose synthase/poly-beta-1,6-N-acetylglucosamine synthase-like glycosyltransferase